MLRFLVNKFFHESDLTHQLSDEYLQYASKAYPSNHTYYIHTNKTLSPTRQLAMRYKKISALFPNPLTSFLDIGCSKGFFVFASNDYPTCERSLGIDITDYDINFCQQVNHYLQNKRTQFALLKLHELADCIDQFGGPFQTVQVINLYQYLYFGSDRAPDCYLDHDKIFSLLRAVCSSRIIFNNRIQLAKVQNDRWVAAAGEHAKHYNEAAILDAAARYFIIKDHGLIGQYPLLTLDVK